MVDAMDNETPEVPRINPSVLTGEATRAATRDLLAQLAADRGRRRGRPPGSKSTPKMDPVTGQLTGGPGSRPRQHAPSPSTAEELRKKARERAQSKVKRAKELQESILKDGNEALAQLLQGMGVPAQFIYVKPPEVKVVDTNFTPWMNRIAIQPMTARILGLTAAELEASDIGGKVVDVVTADSPIRLVVLSVASVAMIGRQVKAILDLRAELEPVITAYRQAQAQEEQRQKEAAKNG